MAASSNPFAATGTWLRCALHAHTTRSDGELSPAELVALYERAGFDVLAITDHWVRTDAPSTERLLVIPSSELSCLKKSMPGPTSLSEPPFASAAANTPDTAEFEVSGLPFSATLFLYADPRRSLNVFGAGLTRLAL